VIPDGGAGGDGVTTCGTGGADPGVVGAVGLRKNEG
jgi:hypothetical protein